MLCGKKMGLPESSSRAMDSCAVSLMSQTFGKLTAMFIPGLTRLTASGTSRALLTGSSKRYAVFGSEEARREDDRD